MFSIHYMFKIARLARNAGKYFLQFYQIGR